MVKTYILAPNWTTAPPPDGPIKLGHVLDDLTELVPLNRNSVIDTTELLNPVDVKSGFHTSRNRLVSSELGIFARVIGLIGVGAGADAHYKRDRNDLLSCAKLETRTFDPAQSYVEDTMNLPEIARFMKNGKYKEPVYMVTGLKIGCDASLQSYDETDKGVGLEGGLSPPGFPAQIGGKTALTVAHSEGENWEGSTDFIVAFRVRKIWYQHGKLKHKTNKENVVMQDGTAVQKEQSLLLRVDDEVSLDEIVTETELTVDKDVEDGEEVHWIIPNVFATHEQDAERI